MGFSTVAAKVARLLPLRARWGTRRGQLWEVPSLTAPGQVHRLLIGHGGRAANVSRVMQHERVQLVVTDPPYCSGGNQEAGRAGGTHGVIASDNLSSWGFCALLSAVLDAAEPDAAYICTDWRMWSHLQATVETAGLPVRDMVVWDKVRRVPGGLRWRRHELVMYADRHGCLRRPGENAHDNVIRTSRTANAHHYTEKPVDLVEELLAGDEVGERGACVVLDPFSGSGTTMLAGERRGRPTRSIEVTPLFAAVHLERAKRAGLAPRLVEVECVRLFAGTTITIGDAGARARA